MAEPVTYHLRAEILHADRISPPLAEHGFQAEGDGRAREVSRVRGYRHGGRPDTRGAVEPFPREDHDRMRGPARDALKGPTFDVL